MTGRTVLAGAALGTVDCYDCGGTGAVPAGGGEDPADVDNGYVRCSTCHGDGYLTACADCGEGISGASWGGRCYDCHNASLLPPEAVGESWSDHYIGTHGEGW